MRNPCYATYLHNSGWYVDGVVSFGAFDGHVSTDLRGRTSGLSGKSFSASVETGYPIALGNGLVLEPQAQLIYQRLMFDRKTDIDNFAVSLGNQDQLIGRLGTRLSRTFTAGNDNLVTVYAKANLMHGFISGGKVFLGDTFRLGRYGTQPWKAVSVSTPQSRRTCRFMPKAPISIISATTESAGSPSMAACATHSDWQHTTRTEAPANNRGFYV